MTDLNEIIRDLNVTIADAETVLCNCASRNDELVRAIGQLKAARASLVRTNKAMEVSQ